MKKDRNCGMPYPTYNMQGQMPMMPIPYQMPCQMPYQSNDNQNDMITQLNNLEKRISVLENILNSNNHYNNTNYQMM